MKAKLEFDLPEEESEFLHAVHGMDFMLSLYDLDNELRRMLKYTELDAQDEKMVQYVRDFLHETMAERNINFEL